MKRLTSELFPKLHYNQYKGNNGRIGVLGGSQEYTGAPYFSGITFLYSGADLSFIFCDKSASVAIKSYNPDIIVHPLLPLNTDNLKLLK